ncbi:MAG: hypothetical protein WCJ94_07255 [bacterium]
MLPREWPDSEIGNALENRDDIKLQQLFDSGRKFRNKTGKFFISRVTRSGKSQEL